MSAVSERTSNTNEEDESVFLAEIEELKKKRDPEHELKRFEVHLNSLVTICANC